MRHGQPRVHAHVQRPHHKYSDKYSLGDSCEWDDCNLTCKETTKIVASDLEAKTMMQREGTCSFRGWEWNHTCTGSHSYCYQQSYKVPDAVFSSTNQCGLGQNGVTYCMADCLALNKLALDPEFAAATEPLWEEGAFNAVQEGGVTLTASQMKARHFCGNEDRCQWKAGGATGPGQCEWVKGCGQSWPSWVIKQKPFAERADMLTHKNGGCDEDTCALARSGGGGSPIDLHGQCESVAVVRNLGGRLRNSRCLEKCELRGDATDCMSRGKAGWLSEDGWYADAFGAKAQCGAPMWLTNEGDSLLNRKYKLGTSASTGYGGAPAVRGIPQECVSMCRWIQTDSDNSAAGAAATGTCFTSCEFRLSEGDCVGSATAPSGCVWDPTAETGVLEIGGLPQTIACSGTPAAPLHSADPAVLRQEALAKQDAAAPGHKGGGGFGGPVSTCILAAYLEDGRDAAQECYATVTLKLTEPVYVPPVAAVANGMCSDAASTACSKDDDCAVPAVCKGQPIDRSTCKQTPKRVVKATLAIDITAEPEPEPAVDGGAAGAPASFLSFLANEEHSREFLAGGSGTCSDTGNACASDAECGVCSAPAPATLVTGFWCAGRDYHGTWYRTRTPWPPPAPPSRAEHALSIYVDNQSADRWLPAPIHPFTYPSIHPAPPQSSTPCATRTTCCPTPTSTAMASAARQRRARPARAPAPPASAACPISTA